MDADRLGIAPAFEVEHSAVAPAVLIVADEAARRVGRQCRLAGSAQAEEQGHVRAVRVGVGGAVHRKHALRREEVVEGGEDRLLDLPGVAGAADDHDPTAEVDQDEGLAPRAVALSVRLHGGQRDDGEVGLEAHLLVRGRADEQVAGEQAVPGELADDADPQPEPRVGAGKYVLRVDLARPDELLHPAQELVELGRRDRLVAWMPPDRVLAGRLLDEEFVLWRAAGVLACLGRQRAGRDDRRFFPPDRLFIKSRGTQIASFDRNLTLRDHGLNATTRCGSGCGSSPAGAACR